MGAQVRGAVYKRQRCTFLLCLLLVLHEVCVHAHIGIAEITSSEQFTVNPGRVLCCQRRWLLILGMNSNIVV